MLYFQIPMFMFIGALGFLYPEPLLNGLTLWAVLVVARFTRRNL